MASDYDQAVIEALQNAHSMEATASEKWHKQAAYASWAAGEAEADGKAEKAKRNRLLADCCRDHATAVEEIVRRG